MEWEHNGTERDGDIVILGCSGMRAQWDRKGWGYNDTGAQWDGKGQRLGYNGTGAQWDGRGTVGGPQFQRDLS